MSCSARLMLASCARFDPTHVGEEGLVLLTALLPGLEDGVPERGAVKGPNQATRHRLHSKKRARRKERGQSVPSCAAASTNHTLLVFPPIIFRAQWSPEGRRTRILLSCLQESVALPKAGLIPMEAPLTRHHGRYSCGHYLQ